MEMEKEKEKEKLVWDEASFLNLPTIGSKLGPQLLLDSSRKTSLKKRILMERAKKGPSLIGQAKKTHLE